MKKLIIIFSGLLIMALMCVALILSGFIYDTGEKITVDTYFFQPGDTATMRIDEVLNDKELGADAMRERLIAKYITEYFYVTPDITDISRRKEGRTSLARMSTRAVFADWLEKVAPELESMAQNKALRTVSLLTLTQDVNKQYWIADYELKTWLKPNNFAASPDVSRGKLYLGVIYEPGIRDEVRGSSVQEYLESGGDPAAAFKFVVIDVASHD